MITITFTDETTVTLTDESRKIDAEVALAIHDYGVDAEGFLNRPEWESLSLRFVPCGLQWEVTDLPDVRSEEKVKVLRSVITALALAVDEWATPARFAAAKVEAAAAAVQEAQAAADLATQRLADAQAAYDKLA